MADIAMGSAAFLVAAARYGAAALAAAGIEELRRTLPVAPERAVEDLRQDM